MTTLHASGAPGTGKLHWSRIVGGAFLLELVLFAVLVPVGLTFGMPGAPGATDFTVFFIAVPVGCLVAGYAISARIFRRTFTRHALHGALLGVTATLLYLAICAVQPGGIPAVIAGYGALLFWASQALRIAGCVLGASHGGRKDSPRGDRILETAAH
jgi:hypothetical protein